MNKVTVIFVILNITYLAAAEVRMPCRLVWKQFMTGEEFPENVVKSHLNEHFVARYHGFGGRAENKSGLAYIPVKTDKGNRVAIRTRVYEILTNPYDCALSWVQTLHGGIIPEPIFAWGTGLPNRAPYVGRISILSESESIQLAGNIDGDFMYVVDPKVLGVHEKIGGAAKSLRTTINLRCEMSDFKFNETLEEGAQDFIGMDTIHNDSPVTVTQVVEHRKSITESYSFTESNSKSEVSSFSIGISIPIDIFSFKAGFSIDTYNSNTESLTITHQEEKEIISRRTIIVPPYTSIQACSVLSVHDDDKGKPYTARGKYTIFGHTAATVEGILLRSGTKQEDIIRHEGSAVFAHISGSLVVSVPTRTKFIIASIDDEAGCTGLQAKINQRQRAKMFGKTSPSELRNMDLEIKNLINRM